MNDKEVGLEPAVIQQVYIYTYICYGRQLSTSMLYDLTVGSTYVARVVLFLLHHLLCVCRVYSTGDCVCVCVCVCACVC